MSGSLSAWTSGYHTKSDDTLNAIQDIENTHTIFQVHLSIVFVILYIRKEIDINYNAGGVFASYSTFYIIVYDNMRVSVYMERHSHDQRSI